MTGRAALTLAVVATALASDPSPAAALAPRREPSWAQAPVDGSHPRAARIAGVVYDSISHATLAGAVVQLVSQTGALRLTATTDSMGLYDFPRVERGRFLLGFFHEKLDSLGLAPPVTTVEVRDAALLAVDLAVPSTSTVVERRCGAGATRDSSGAMLGFVRSAETTVGVARASVRARWSEIVIGKRGAGVQVREVTTRADDDGWFTLCRIPAGGLMLVRASSDADSGATLELSVPADGLLNRDLLVATRNVGPTGMASTVRGTVRTPYGDALAGARVRLFGDEREVRSNERGEFVLAELPAGTRMLELRALGYAPRRALVDLAASQELTVDLALEEFPTTIDTLRVFGAAPAGGDALAGFARRRALSQGVFLDPEGVERRRPLNFSDLVRGIAGVDVVTIDGARAIAMRSLAGDGTCEPELVMDGVRVLRYDSDIDHLIPASIVRALEVYPRRIQAPPEFQAPDCGTIVVWTGARGWLARRGRGSKG